MLFRPRSEKVRVRVWREVDLWRDMILREKEREFGRRREEATIGGGGCDEPALPIWACLRRTFLVDTLALVRGLEAQRVPSKQAEAITAAMTEVLNDSLENVAHSFVSKAEMQRHCRMT